MKTYGSLMNRVAEAQSMPKPTVGQCATKMLYTDRHAGTISWVSDSGKTLRWKRDKAKRVDANGASEHQEYEYSPDENAVEVQFRLNKSGWRDRDGNGLLIGERDEYFDFSF